MPYLFVSLALLMSIFGLDIAKPAPALACKPAARVVNFDHPNYEYGDLLCFEQVPKLSAKEQLRVVCLNDFRIQILEQKKDLNRCPRTRYGTSVPVLQRKNGVTRLGQIVNPIVELPLGATFKGSRLKLRWLSVAQASGYRVTIDNGDGDLRNIATKQNELVVANLQPGKSYLISIRALAAGTEGQSTTTVKIIYS
jgi:hypothetical protein